MSEIRIIQAKVQLPAKSAGRTRYSLFRAPVFVAFIEKTMKHLKIIFLLLFSTNVFGTECIVEFSEKKIFNSIYNGTGIHYPFKLSLLADGADDLELITSSLDKEQQEQISKLSYSLYTESINRSAMKTIAKNGDLKAAILYRGLNSGWHVTWYFQKLDGCWLAIGLNNEST